MSTFRESLLGTCADNIIQDERRSRNNERRVEQDLFGLEESKLAADHVCGFEIEGIVTDWAKSLAILNGQHAFMWCWAICQFHLDSIVICLGKRTNSDKSIKGLKCEEQDRIRKE